MFFYSKSFFSIAFVIIINFQSFSQDLINYSDSLIVSEIIIKGNDKTKQNIIMRELLFEVGDKVDLLNILQTIEKSRGNLLNTSLFNFVTINYKIQDEINLIISIDLQERWYFWPYPVFEHADRNLSSFIRNQDWSRVDYGLYLLINNFRGRNETLKIRTLFGFNDRITLFYSKPYVDKKQKIGLGFDFDFVNNHEVAYNTIEDKLSYLKLSDRYVRKTITTSLFATYRPQLYFKHQINFRYSDVSVVDSLIDLNQNYFYNYQSNISYFSLEYRFQLDKRDSKIYPLKGYRLNLSLIKDGIGIFSNKGTFYLKSILEENLKLNKFILNSSIETKYSFSLPNAYYFNEAIGYNNYLRGMEYYVTSGRNYYISKSNFKYEIIPQTKFDLNFISSDKFSKAHYALYMNLFFDTGYVDSKNNRDNSLINKFLYSGGIGIDLVTYYDKVLRIEYSLNKFGEHGIFLHLGAPIIEK